mmetsp:Transcript_6222/g.8154  ORF Transcript_6222/g.8154 Transcript_6222/m.8154 type:complete len:325 (+) Transcript_6222:109-1083(+)
MATSQINLGSLSRAKCIFDLNGYIVIRNVLSKTEVEMARKGIQEYRGTFVERAATEVRNTSSDSSSNLKGDGRTGRFDMGGMLGWSSPCREVFRQFLAHPNLVPYLHLFLGEGYRLDHSPLVLRQKPGSEGFSLHGGPIDSKGAMQRGLIYQCNGKDIHNSLLAVSFQLSDGKMDSNSGGFCVVPGSHKMKFPLSSTMINGQDEDFFAQCVAQPEVNPGDCIIFSEATVHGCTAWKEKSFDRYIALYRFAPANFAYGRGYQYDGGWPESFLTGMTKEQEAVMLPPFNTRLDRERLNDDGTLAEPIRRSAKKKEFDQLVFQQKYF